MACLKCRFAHRYYLLANNNSFFWQNKKKKAEKMNLFRAHTRIMRLFEVNLAMGAEDERNQIRF